MYHDHGENDRLDYQPQPAKLTAWQMLMIRLGVTRRNRRDSQVKTAREIAEQAVCPLSKIGGGR